MTQKMNVAAILAVKALNKVEKISADDVILKYDRQLPRYTSYPTAPHFSDKINGEIYAKWLRDLDQENLSLYIHIPFCNQLCWYCGCFTKATQRYAPVEDYAHILAREIKIVADNLQKNHKVSHIHFGGGSPTILLPADFQFLIETIKSNFKISKNAEIAIEVDPRNINEEKVQAYANCGVNRVSLGVQDFNIEVQKAINREQSFETVYDAVKLFHKYKIEDINLDLIYGLPKQTVEMVKKNIDFAMLLNPKRIALFSYAHVTWVKKHMRLIDEKDLPNAKTKIEMFKIASTELLKKDFVAVGLDHFAKKNDTMKIAYDKKILKRNFQGYSSDHGSVILGFGASAIGYLSQGYVQNTLDFEEYKKNILSEKLPIKKGIAISNEDKMRKKIIDEIMCYFETDLNKICEEFNLEKNYFARELKLLEELKKDNLVIIEDNKIFVSRRFPQACRIVASFFDQYLQADNKKHSKIA